MSLPNHRLAGHELRGEGAPYKRVGRSSYDRLNSGWSSAGIGRALCSCGAMSDVLDSGNARKQWHRDHKAEVRNHHLAEATNPEGHV